ncbi:AIPR family protein [Emcibacteraceae bacterium]|nr:AIPR family protein [Emcibacteraceae bacterium]
MIENLEIEEFYKTIRAEINDENTEILDEGYRVDRFTNLVANYLGDFGVISDANIYAFDKKMGSSRVISNAWYVDEEEGRLSIFISNFVDQDQVTPVVNSEVSLMLKQALRIYEYAKKIELNSLEPASSEYTMLRTIKDSLTEITQIRVYFLTDGVLKNTGDGASTVGDLPVYYSYWDIQRLYRLVSSGRQYEPIDIDFSEKFGKSIDCLTMPSGTDEYSGFLAIIPGDILASLYDEYGPRLMELNVRSFLQQRGKVNKGIRETILNEPQRFLAYNNGISATAEEIRTERNSDGNLVIKGITGLQIVNGGQTVASISRAKKNDRCEHLDILGVQAKISVVKADILDELIPKISRYSNTQNTVNEADFSSNDPFHVSIEKLSNSIWAPGEQARWFYERARGQYEVSRNRIAGHSAAKRRVFDQQTPKQQKIVKTDLAKYYNCWEQKPNIVGLGAQKSFINFIKHIANDHPEFVPDEEFYKDIIAKAIIYKTAEKIARKHKFPSYRANAIAYTVSLVSFKTIGRFDLRTVWDNQEVPQVLYEVLNDWMPIVWESLIETAGSRNVTEWAKKEECWAELQLLDLDIPASFENVLRVGDPLPTVGKKARSGKADKLSTIDRQNINRVLQHNADFWWRLGIWGRKTNLLSEIQLNIIHSISGYAKDDWEKIPSAKQSKHCVRALEVAKEENFSHEDE